MPNTSPRPAIPSRICPSCGTRIADTASRCAVCGMVFEGGSGRTGKIPSRISGTSASLKSSRRRRHCRTDTHASHWRVGSGFFGAQRTFSRFRIHTGDDARFYAHYHPNIGAYHHAGSHLDAHAPPADTSYGAGRGHLLWIDRKIRISRSQHLDR